mmetsp:Transcript_54666/g.153442  ORF Transcript_54666/g.153442 Transcript_54666/m.153442 type:complete len:103 (-) Transcript_54666:37-345(-)
MKLLMMLAFLPLVASLQLPPGVYAAGTGKLIDEAGVQVNLFPPSESAALVDQDLAGILKLELDKFRMTSKQDQMAKQTLLQESRRKIREAVPRIFGREKPVP